MTSISSPRPGASSATPQRTLRRVDATEVQVGDDLIYLGEHRRIVEIRPYVGSLFSAEDGARIAYSHGNWSVTLLPGHGWWVA